REPLVPAAVATAYGEFLWKHNRTTRLLKDKKNDRSRFYMGLSVEGDTDAFERVTKRATLVSDTLLLSHKETEELHDIQHKRILRATRKTGDIRPDSPLSHMRLEANNTETRHGMHCPDLEGLGSWLLDSAPLLKAGLAWYLPTYSTYQKET